MQTATSETERKSLVLSICVHHYTLRAPCTKGQGKDCTPLDDLQMQVIPENISRPAILFRVFRRCRIPGTRVQYPGLQGGGALGDASTSGKPDGSMAARTHGGTYSHVAVAGGARGGERGAAAATAAAAARRRGATPTGGAVTPPRSAPAGGRDGTRVGGADRPPCDGAHVTAPVDGVSNRRRAAAAEAGAQARSPPGHRGSFEPRKTLHVVAARNSGRQAPSGPCDPFGRTVLLSHVTLFAFSVIVTLPTLTRPQIREDTNADCHLWSGEQVCFCTLLQHAR